MWRETRNVEKYEGRMVSKTKLERASLSFVLTICASRISEPELEKKTMQNNEGDRK